MRKLASIQIVKDIKPIPNADAIVVATILGWKVVIKKDEFKVGDKVIYCEIDCLFPKEERYDFLERVNYRIKTVKFRGQISQGLCLPLSYLPQDKEYEIDEEVTNLLGITKYEIPLDLSIGGDTKGFIPGFIRKTGETRVQNLQHILTKNKGKKCYLTEKVEGTSSTFYLKNNEYGVCGHNYEYKDTENNVFHRISKQLHIEKNLRKLNRNLAIQGELVGDKIQRNIYKYKTNQYDLFIFSILDINTYEYLPFDEFITITQELGLKTVPIIETEFILDDNIDALVALSIGQSLINPITQREGLVIRGIENPSQLSFKVINPEYLLRQK